MVALPDPSLLVSAVTTKFCNRPWLLRFCGLTVNTPAIVKTSPRLSRKAAAVVQPDVSRLDPVCPPPLTTGEPPNGPTVWAGILTSSNHSQPPDVSIWPVRYSSEIPGCGLNSVVLASPIVAMLFAPSLSERMPSPFGAPCSVRIAPACQYVASEFGTVPGVPSIHGTW